MWNFSGDVICLSGTLIIGNHSAFKQWAQTEHNYDDFRPDILYSAMASEAYHDYFAKNIVRHLISRPKADHVIANLL